MPQTAPFELAGILIRTPDPSGEAHFWSRLLNRRAVQIDGADPGSVVTSARASIDVGAGLSLFFASGAQKPPTVVEPEKWSGKSPVHVCWATDDAESAITRLTSLGADVRVSADRGIAFHVFTSPAGQIDGCVLDAASWDEQPPESWKLPTDDGHWMVAYYVTIDAPDVVPSETDQVIPDPAAGLAAYGHGISAIYWHDLVGGVVSPYGDEAASSYAFYVPIVRPQTHGVADGLGRTILIQRVQDGTRTSPLGVSCVVPVICNRADPRPGENASAATTLADPYGNEILVWPARLVEARRAPSAHSRRHIEE